MENPSGCTLSWLADRSVGMVFKLRNQDFASIDDDGWARGMLCSMASICFSVLPRSGALKIRYSSWLWEGSFGNCVLLMMCTLKFDHAQK